MTRFLDVRLDPVGGDLATEVGVFQGTSLSNYQTLDANQLRNDIRGRHVLIGTHGFNVDRANGIACLSNWEGLLQLGTAGIFVGLLWPGDSTWAHGLDYPEEPKIANRSGSLLAPFIDANFNGAASVSFASHSLGARVLLETVSQMNLPVRRAMIMAGAIDDNCLDTEFQAATQKVGRISALASKKDDVLAYLFPLGDLVAGILTAGHPWWHAALGRTGPVTPIPGNFEAPFEIPSNWGYGHHDYLRIAGTQPTIPLPVDVPPEGSPEPAASAQGWQEAFSAAFCSTRFE